MQEPPGRDGLVLVPSLERGSGKALIAKPAAQR
jgi:hypothetical protein